MRLQRRFLERAGHTVTIVAPRDRRRPRPRGRRSRRSRTARPPTEIEHAPSELRRGARAERAPAGRGRSSEPRPKGARASDRRRRSVRRDISRSPPTGSRTSCTSRVTSGAPSRVTACAPRGTAGRAHDAQQGGCRPGGDRALSRAGAARPERVAAAGAAAGDGAGAARSRRMGVPRRPRRLRRCRDGALGALRPPARGAGVFRGTRGRDLERHRRRRPRRGDRRGAHRTGARSTSVRVARADEPREATAPLSRGRRRVAHPRRRRGDRRRSAGEARPTARRAAAARGIRHLRRPACRTRRPSVASPAPTRWCRRRSASRRRG